MSDVIVREGEWRTGPIDPHRSSCVDQFEAYAGFPEAIPGGIDDSSTDPVLGDDFFDGFGAFDDYFIADSLRSREIDQIDEADEYLVYEGWLEFEDGYDFPGYVMFLSSDGMVYILIGFADDRSDLFDLAEEILDRGEAPRTFDGYDREPIDL